jgi:uncharacterized protein with HEPN domain
LKSSERDSILYLEDIIISMQRVQEYVAGLDFQHFKWDYKTVDAVIRNFEIIGEASKNLPKLFKDKYINIPWEAMYRLRNRISHEYFGMIMKLFGTLRPDSYLQITMTLRKF